MFRFRLRTLLILMVVVLALASASRADEPGPTLKELVGQESKGRAARSYLKAVSKPECSQ
jgi:hypothetical protein